MELWWFIIYTIDIIFFIGTALTVLYMTVFAIASQFDHNIKVPTARHKNRFIVLIPSYRNDSTVEQTVKSILGQTYPQRMFDVTVISDHQKEITNFHLAQYPITLLTPNFQNSTKIKSLQLAINNLPQFKIYDIVVILDADNLVEPEFLQQMNDAFETAGTKAIQAHRLSRNRDTAIACLDATFEEINNSVFRRGHVTLGLSSAISGSGVAFEYKWFKENIMRISTKGEDKDIEARLMRQRIYVDYFDNIPVYDEKTRHAGDFYRQRRRWVFFRLRSILLNIRYLPVALLSKHYDQVDKIIQWMLIPNTIMMGIIVLMSIILPFIYLTLAIKWWIMFAFIMFIFALATPNYLVDNNWDRAFIKAPFIIFKSLLKNSGRKSAGKKAGDTK